MGLFSIRNKNINAPKWVVLNDPSQLEELRNDSKEKAVLIFKHSTRCSISSMAKNRLESDWDISEEEVMPVYLDLIAHRSISNQIAEEFNIMHESPQVILLKNGHSIYNASHGNISVHAIRENI
jgi:monothiol bacilliredoxin